MSVFIYILIGALFILFVLALMRYIKIKQKYTGFIKKTLDRLPYNKEEILEMEIIKKDSKTRYFLTFMKNEINCTHMVDKNNLKIIYDLEKNEKPYIMYKYLLRDVYFPEDKDFVLMHGVYNEELHTMRGYKNPKPFK